MHQVDSKTSTAQYIGLHRNTADNNLLKISNKGCYKAMRTVDV